MIRLYPDNKKYLEIRLTDRTGKAVDDANPTVTFLSSDKLTESCPAIQALVMTYKTGSRGVYTLDIPANHDAPKGEGWLRFAATDVTEYALCLVADREF